MTEGVPLTVVGLVIGQTLRASRPMSRVQARLVVCGEPYELTFEIPGGHPVGGTVEVTVEAG